MAQELEGWTSNQFKPILDDSSSSSSDSESESDSDDEELQAPRGIASHEKVYKKIIVTEEELLPE